MNATYQYSPMLGILTKVVSSAFMLIGITRPVIIGGRDGGYESWKVGELREERKVCSSYVE